MVWTKHLQNSLHRFLLMGLALFLFPSPVLSEVGFRSDLTFVSRYIWRGFDTICDDRPALQPSFTLTFGKSGAWLNLWSAFALKDTDFVELDLIVGYQKSLSKGVDFSAGLGYFTFPSMPNYPDKNSTTPEVYAGISVSSLPLWPTLTIYYDFNLGDGVYLTLSFSPCLRLVNERFQQVFYPIIQIGYTNQYQSIRVDPGISDICLGISTDFGLKGMTFTPSLNYVIVPNKTINNENEIWLGLGMSWTTN